MKHVKGNALTIFEELPKNAVLIHQVNCRGVMGSGIAKQIREVYPSHYEDYKDSLSVRGRDSVCLGDHLISNVSSSGKEVIALFSQRDFGTKTRHTNYAAIARALMDVASSLTNLVSQPTLIIPKYIGCGLGGGDWDIVEKIILDVEDATGVEFTCVEYDENENC